MLGAGRALGEPGDGGTWQAASHSAAAMVLPAGFTLDDVIAAIKGHAIGHARLDGTYAFR
jgi:hypothetical protein